MRVFNGENVQHKCLDCSLSNSGFFCNFSRTTLQTFESIKITNTYPKGARLFIEGGQPEGVFVLCRGRVKLTTHSHAGKALILRIAVPGEVLGLSAVILNSVNETTAEVIEPCQVNFVRKADFTRFLEQNAEAGINALRQLSIQYKKGHALIRSLGLSNCVADRLATLLLEWSKDEPSRNGSVHLKVSFSHEEIAEMIGTSRETVTRLLKDFRERNLISIQGTDLQIPDLRKLETTNGNGTRTKSSYK